MVSLNTDSSTFFFLSAPHTKVYDSHNHDTHHYCCSWKNVSNCTHIFYVWTGFSVIIANLQISIEVISLELLELTGVLVGSIVAVVIETVNNTFWGSETYSTTVTVFLWTHAQACTQHRNTCMHHLQRCSTGTDWECVLHFHHSPGCELFYYTGCSQMNTQSFISWSSLLINLNEFMDINIILLYNYNYIYISGKYELCHDPNEV